MIIIKYQRPLLPWNRYTYIYIYTNIMTISPLSHFYLQHNKAVYNRSPGTQGHGRRCPQFFSKNLRTPADTLRTPCGQNQRTSVRRHYWYVRSMSFVSAVCPQYVLRVLSVSSVCPQVCPQVCPWMNEFFVPCESFVCPSYVLRVSAGVLRLSFVCPSFVRRYIPWMNEWIYKKCKNEWICLNLSESVWR